MPPAYHYPVSWHRYPDVISVIMFNTAYPGYESIAALLHKIYMPVFGHVVFTGQDVPDGLLREIAWVPCTDVSRGQLMHKCLGHVMEMYPLASSSGGYLMIGDDTLLDNCALQALNSSKIWLQDAHTRLATPQRYENLPISEWFWNSSLNGGKAVRVELYDAIVSLTGLARTAAEKQGILKLDATPSLAYYTGAWTDFFMCHVLMLHSSHTSRTTFLSTLFIMRLQFPLSCAS